MNLSSEAKLTLAKAGQVTGTSAVDSDGIDMSGFEGVLFFGTFATANAGNFVKAQQSADNVTFADLTGTKVTPTANGNAFLLDVYRPEARYVRCTVTRGVTTILGDIFALVYGARARPVTQATTTQSETHGSPIEGTA